MKKARDMGGAEARIDLENLENHVLGMVAHDAALADAIAQASETDTLVDILISLNPPRAIPAESAAETVALEIPGSTSEGAAAVEVATEEAEPKAEAAEAESVTEPTAT